MNVYSRDFKEILKKRKGVDLLMSDWNEQAAPNNNNPSGTIRTSKLVGKEGLHTSASVDNSEGLTELSSKDKDREDLAEHLLSRQPGM
jgi:hypothetical protein